MPHGVKFPPEVKALALELAQEIGVSAAAERMGVDETTIWAWQKGDGVESAGSNKGAMDGNYEYWRQWRQTTALRTAKAVDHGLTLAEIAAENGLTRNFREAMLGTAIAIDKVLALTGAATSHHTQSVSIQLDVGYSEQMTEFARIDAIRTRAIEASSTETPADVQRDIPIVTESTVVTDR